MPLYEYQCDACGNQFEVIRKFSDPPLETCPKCGVTGKVRKLLSSPAFQFKGSGWYATDYAKKSGDSGGSGKSSDDKSSSKTETESKTETKTDAAAKDTAAPAADKPAATAPASSTTKDK
jgi:putative FmdB family regulatory protein